MGPIYKQQQGIIDKIYGKQLIKNILQDDQEKCMLIYKHADQM